MLVRVEYVHGATDVRRIRTAIEGFGYRVRETPQGGGTVTAEDSEAAARRAEYVDLRRKFWIAAVLSTPVLIIAMSHGRIPLFNVPWIAWLQLALTAPVVFYAGAQFYRDQRVHVRSAMTKRRPRTAIELRAGVEHDGCGQCELQPGDPRHVEQRNPPMRHRDDQHGR